MDTQDLKEYLGMVVDMEANCHLLETLKQELRGELASIQAPRPSTFALPSRPVEPVKPKMPSKPKMPERLNWSYVLVYMLLGALGSIVLAMAVPCIFALIFFPFDLIWDLLALSIGHTNFPAISNTIGLCIEIAVHCFKFALKYAVLPGAVIVGFMEFCKLHTDFEQADCKYKEELSEYNRKYNEVSDNYKQSMRQFQSDITAYQKAKKQYQLSVQEDNERVQVETVNNEKRRSFLKRALGDLEKRTEEAKKCLRDLYKGDIIFPKYQNIIGVCAIYEYICAGRCSTLGEAYNILEMEKRLDCMITQLESIRANQYELFKVLQTNQQILSDIENSNRKILQRIIEGNRKLDDIQSDKLSSYYEELERKERDYKNRKDHFQ